MSATGDKASAPGGELRARRLGVHSRDEALVFLRADCFVCRSEGFAPRARVRLRANGGEALATLFQVDGDWLKPNEAGLSEAAWDLLGVTEGQALEVSHPPPLDSAGALRRRIYGHRLNETDFAGLIREMATGRTSEVQIAAFLTACATLPLDEAETLSLTRAMVGAGERLTWSATPVLDKHSVGGLPGNRTSPLVVAIVAAHGLTIPKTSSRAITSPAGTADAMDTMTRVDLSIEEMRRVVEREHGCLAWGGAVRLSPADDVLIRVERALDIDPEGQLIASVLSKKIAAGATHVVIDMPVGPTAKVRDEEAALRLKSRLEETAWALGLVAEVAATDGAQPIGRGVGPALEAWDVLAVLQDAPDAPLDLIDKACVLAGRLLEIGGAARVGQGLAMAHAALVDGRAWSKFQSICEAQGGLRQPPRASHRRPLNAVASGVVSEIDNRRVARLAKLAGAPDARAAGVEMHVRLGDRVAVGQPLLTVHAMTRGELDYALAWAAANPEAVTVRPA